MLLLFLFVFIFGGGSLCFFSVINYADVNPPPRPTPPLSLSLCAPLFFGGMGVRVGVRVRGSRGGGGGGGGVVVLFLLLLLLFFFSERWVWDFLFLQSIKHFPEKVVPNLDSNLVLKSLEIWKAVGTLARVSPPRVPHLLIHSRQVKPRRGANVQ